MSCSKWKWTEACDGDFCIGDCDLCSKNMEDDMEELTVEKLLLMECINELCLRCGEYRHEHLGACNGCKWYKRKRGEA